VLTIFSMIEITQAHAESSAAPSAFFARWADMATWPEWNADTEWVRLDGPFATGSTGTLKPKGGPEVKFTIASVVDGREFVDVSHLLGARLTFDHQVTPHETGCAVDVTVSMSGPLAFLWRTALGKSLAAAAQPDLDSLVATVEADARA
jgi:Polyketide cyclase / dehydrase and lipid transport